VLLDRNHSRWATLSGLTLALATAAWFFCAAGTPNGNSGGSVSGLIFGLLGTLMMFFAGLLGARRPLRHRRIGSASFWLKGHLWLGTLCIPFILFHASFAWGGPLEQILWICLILVAASGFFGLAVQQFLPRLLWKNVPLESFEPQSPWLCDRMTLSSDIRIAAACESSFPEISEHLLPTARHLVNNFDEISAGKESRGEKNARKLLLMQQLSPADQRDFFWSMAKVAKSELKALTFEGDFPELLKTIYQNLRDQAPGNDNPDPPKNVAAPAPTVHAESPPAAPARNRTTPPPKEQSQSPQTTPPKTSPLELMKQKAAEKAAAAAAENNSTPAPAEPPELTAEIPAPATPQPKLSPLELMKQKAAEKAAAAAAENNSTPAPAEPPELTAEIPAPATPQPKLSPLELMKQKAAEKAAAAAAENNSTPAPAEPPELTAEIPAPATPQPKLSPLELMKQKAAEKAAAENSAAPPATPGENTPAATTAAPAVAKELPRSIAKRSLPPAKTTPPAPGATPTPPVAKASPASPSPEDRQILWNFYTQLVRPFLANSRSAATINTSPLANDVDAGRRFREIRVALPVAQHDLLQELQVCCDTRRQIEQQRTILRWMHWWLALHIPVSMLLIVFTIAHVVMALRVVPFRF